MLRETLSRNPRLASTVVVVLLAVAATVAVMNLRGDGVKAGSEPTWYLDEGSGGLFVAPAALPPIDTASGPGAGVQAMVFACRDCSDAGDRFTGYLVKYTVGAKQFNEQLDRAQRSDDPAKRGQAAELARRVQEGRLVRRPDDKEWAANSSAAGQAIIASVNTRCNPDRPQRCQPGR